MTPLQWYRHESSLVRLHATPTWTHATWDTIDDCDDLDEDEILEDKLVALSEECPPLTSIRRDGDSGSWCVVPDFRALHDAVNDGDCALIDDGDRHGTLRSLDDVDCDETPLVALVNDHGNTTLKLHVPASRIVPGGSGTLALDRYPLLSYVDESEISFCMPSMPCPAGPIERVCASDGRAQLRALRAMQRELGLEGIVDHLAPDQFKELSHPEVFHAIDELIERASGILHPDIRFEMEPDPPRPGQKVRFALDVDITRDNAAGETPTPARPYWLEDIDGHALRIERVGAWITVWAAV